MYLVVADGPLPELSEDVRLILQQMKQELPREEYELLEAIANTNACLLKLLCESMMTGQRAGSLLHDSVYEVGHSLDGDGPLDDELTRVVRRRKRQRKHQRQALRKRRRTSC